MGRPKLIWLVTVRSNDAGGCHIYGVYKTEHIAKAARDHVEAHVGTMNHWPLEKVKGEHWVSVDPYPLSETPKMAYTVAKREVAHNPRTVLVTP